MPPRYEKTGSGATPETSGCATSRAFRESLPCFAEAPSEPGPPARPLLARWGGGSRGGSRSGGRRCRRYNLCVIRDVNSSTPALRKVREDGASTALLTPERPKTQATSPLKGRGHNLKFSQPLDTMLYN